MLAHFKKLRADREGVTALEYGVVAAVTVVVIAVSFIGLEAPFATVMATITAAL